MPHYSAQKICHYKEYEEKKQKKNQNKQKQKKLANVL